MHPLKQSLSRMASVNYARAVFSGWSSETRESVTETFEELGGALIAEKIIANFTIALARVPFQGTNYHIVCLNTGDLSPTNPDLRFGKTPGGSPDLKLVILEISAILKYWISKYGKLVISSGNARKFQAFERILKKQGFTFEPFPYELSGEQASYVLA